MSAFVSAVLLGVLIFVVLYFSAFLLDVLEAFLGPSPFRKPKKVRYRRLSSIVDKDGRRMVVEDEEWR